ncbi:insulinase family protein [Tamlana fucoidanivorans]|uniref:Insulinase family protein n=1 Tax=Allotamlana fucoidanivorans TaxID=2583814 RepID=A0A5C4SRD8_9FLAO|nr:M16 family metallopeptidase [Tamlana fucoidanivorans]TNJ46963.1 insulinase family protein [Tamlana fucoidanivorans]
MKNFLLVFSLISITFASAQNLKQELPIDSNIKKDVLPNGLTYYLYSTDVTEDVASYYIIQNVGSVLENDDQQGLAHFLEHMAFNGTEHFEGKGILNTLEKEGIVFGRDINAYTSFDETVYNINNIPTTPELIDTGLQILHDWSNYLLLTDEEIDAERGVIKEEWRTRQSGGLRLFQQSLGVKYGNSKYAKRMPIGLMDIVENFEYETLRNFYHDWYRTDLQAIAIVGDIDIDEMEQKVIAKFSAIPPVENPIERYIVVIDDNDELQYIMVRDPEVSTASVRFGIRHAVSNNKNTVAYLNENLHNSIIRSIFSERFSEIVQQPDSPFINVYAGMRGHSRAHNEFQLNVFPKEGMQKEAFKLAMVEINRAVRHGFTNSEINRAKIKLIKSYENEIAKLDDRRHAEIIQVMQSNYLDNEPIMDKQKEFKIIEQLVKNIDQKSLLNRLNEIYTVKNRTLIVTGVEGQNNLTEGQAKNIISTTENDSSLQPYEEDNSSKSLMTGIALKAGKITKTETHPGLGFTTYTLINGIKVHYQFVDKDKNTVDLLGYSDGGESLIADEDLPSAQMVSSIVSSSGINEFSANELSKVLAGKTARVSIRISDIIESFSGSSTTEDVETMLQLLNLHFTKPRFDKKAFDVAIQNLENNLIARSQNLSYKMNDSIITTLYGYNHPKRRLFNKEYIDDINFDKIQKLYKSRFENASDFEFIIVGDVSEEILKPLIEQYLGSIPTTPEKEKWKDNTVEWTTDNIDKDIYLPMEDPKASVRIAYKNEMPYTIKDELLMDALGSILQLRYTESLREEEGGTYGAGVRGSLSREPRSIAYLSVSFDCNPDMAEKLTSIVHNEILKIKNGNIKQNDLDKVLANFLKERQESKSSNNYEISAIRTWVRDGYNRNAPENFENIVNSITQKDIQEITSKLLDNYKSYEVIFKPELTDQ